MFSTKKKQQQHTTMALIGLCLHVLLNVWIFLSKFFNLAHFQFAHRMFEFQVSRHIINLSLNAEQVNFVFIATMKNMIQLKKVIPHRLRYRNDFVFVLQIHLDLINTLHAWIYHTFGWPIQYSTVLLVVVVCTPTHTLFTFLEIAFRPYQIVICAPASLPL